MVRCGHVGIWEEETSGKGEVSLDGDDMNWGQFKPGNYIL